MLDPEYQSHQSTIATPHKHTRQNFTDKYSAGSDEHTSHFLRSIIHFFMIHSHIIYCIKNHMEYKITKANECNVIYLYFL